MGVPSVLVHLEVVLEPSVVFLASAVWAVIVTCIQHLVKSKETITNDHGKYKSCVLCTVYTIDKKRR